MFEESPEAFITRWRSHAAPVTIFSRVEGSPLLEFEAAGAILQALERTGPYQAAIGPALLIINAVTDEVRLAEGEVEAIDVTGISAGRVQGRVIRREDPFLIVQAGVPLVVGVLGRLQAELQAGVHVTFEVQPPLHAFVMNAPHRSAVLHEIRETAT
jgi:hypothetical protein